MEMTTIIEQSTVEEINRLHGELQGLAVNALDQAIRIGELLFDMKRSLEHGKWLSWLHCNVSFSERTARNYMRVFQERARLKSANVADLTAAYLELDKPSAKFADELAEFWVHHQFGERGTTCWTRKQLQQDLELLEAFEMIEAVYDYDSIVAIRSGLLCLTREDLIYLTSLGETKMNELHDMIMSKPWECRTFTHLLNTAPTKDSTLDEIHDRCMATKEKRLIVSIDGFRHSCELVHPLVPWWKVEFHPKVLSELSTAQSTVDELRTGCMLANNAHLWGYIDGFKHTCERM
jgi:Protein of unknown function (DUF3102)